MRDDQYYTRRIDNEEKLYRLEREMDQGISKLQTTECTLVHRWVVDLLVTMCSYLREIRKWQVLHNEGRRN